VIFEGEVFLCGQCRFAVVGIGLKRWSLKFAKLCCDLYKEMKMAAYVWVCVYVYIYIYVVNLLFRLFRANFVFVMWCISGSACFCAVLDSIFMLWMDSI